jgi:UDP-glucose 4-epimerase
MNILNLSTNKATSCLEIFSICEKLSSKKIPVNIASPREGDPEIVFATSIEAEKLLNWSAKKDITQSLKDQLNWTNKNPKGFS